MPSVTSLTGRIGTNIPAKQAYDALQKASNEVAISQPRISTGRKINTAADDVLYNFKVFNCKKFFS